MFPAVCSMEFDRQSEKLRAHGPCVDVTYTMRRPVRCLYVLNMYVAPRGPFSPQASTSSMGRLESLRSTFGVPNLYLSVLLLAIYHFLKPHLEFLIDIAQTQGTHPPTSSGSLLCATAAPPVSVRGVNEVHTEQLEDGEDGVRSLRRQAIAMLAKSNSLLPIARLPPELLSRIFIECAYQEWSEHQTDRSRFVLSYVSSHWRTVALSTAALWSNVAVHDYRHARKAHELLERAGNSARSLFILFGLSASTKNLQNLSLANRLLEELHRARSLEIYMTRFECGGLIWPASPSSSLRHLRLEGPGYNAFRWLGVRDEDGRFPEIACTLETRFPHLLSLAAVGYSFCFATWQLPPSLTHLHIDNEHCMHVVDLHAVRDLLQSLPALEGLVLLHAVPDLGQLEVDFISSSSPIALDSLKDLRIAGPISVSLSLMGIIRIPSTARRHISLDMQCVSGALDDWFDVFLTQVRKMDDSFQSVAFADDNPQGNFHATRTHRRI
ncbi:hypothetical protein NM688_g6668 [Phlebia brevispora]|uniref:Uncharacterized protein n=1 Tax=Phlebia brevispora TaxID=194682 RepID=A0ACC1SDY3_9APHY|nr:hypothetical protein NM688_g6668 [Phlebia brevispora]